MSASQSLPSFAQAFSVFPRDNIGHNNALPPILRPNIRNDTKHRDQARKRGRTDSIASRDDDGYSSSDRASPPPRSRIIKEEQDYDQLEPSPPPHSSSVSRSKSNHTPRHESANVPPVSSGAPPPSLVRPPTNTKRRRITVSTSDAQQPSINTANLEPAGHQTPGGPAHPHVHTGPSTPISPVVMGLSFQRDNPEAFEAVRAMLSVKQKQKALIESRRGSAAGLPDGRRGSGAGLSDGKRGSVAGIHDSKRNSTSSLPPVAVNIVNPTPTALTAPAGGALAPPKRSRSSPSVTAGRMPTPSGSTNGAPRGSISSSNANSSPRAKASGPGVPPTPTVQRTASPHQSHVVPSQNPRGSMHLSPPSTHNLSHNHARPTQSPSQGPLPPPPTAARPGAPNSQHPTSSHIQLQSHSQQQQLATQGLSALANALPPPPTSFGKRRAAQTGTRSNKPADILISPRDSNASTNGASEGASQSQDLTEFRYSYKSLQPSIQSAPAVPRPGQQAGRFPPMALPTLPATVPQQGASVAIRRSAVPPTPTRLAMQLNQAHGQAGSNVRLSQPTGAPSGIGRSPTNVATSSTLQPNAQNAMPSTPATLHSSQNTSADKTAFLAPFEQFYDALSDARVLKGWFGEQLARVGRLAREAETQRADLEAARAEVERQRADVEKAVATANDMRNHVERWVEEAVERELRTSRDEISWLRKRVNELEEAIWPQSRSFGDNLRKPSKEGHITRPINGLQRSPQHYPLAPGVESYTFPPVQPHVLPPTAIYTAPIEITREGSSPRFLAADREGPSPGGVSVSRSQASSPAPEPGRQMSVSATRYESKPFSQVRGSSNESDASSSSSKIERQLQLSRTSADAITSLTVGNSKTKGEPFSSQESKRETKDCSVKGDKDVNGSMNGGDREQKGAEKEQNPLVSSPHLSSSSQDKDRMDES